MTTAQKIRRAYELAQEAMGELDDPTWTSDLGVCPYNELGDASLLLTRAQVATEGRDYHRALRRDRAVSS